MLSEPSLGAQVQVHPHQLSVPRRLSEDATPFLSESVSAARRGASLAFQKPPSQPTFILNTYSGKNGARAAAITAGTIKQFHNGNDKPLHTHRAVNGGHDPLTAAQRSMARDDTRRDKSSTTNSRARAGERSNPGPSPSNIAAILASTKDSQTRQQTTKSDRSIRHSGYLSQTARHEVRSSVSSQTTTGQEILPHVARGGDTPPDHQSMAMTNAKSQESGVETTHVAPTASLIQLFEKSGREPDETHTVTVSLPAILSPKPIRMISLTNTPLTAALAAAQTLSGHRRSPQDANINSQPDGNTFLSSTARPTFIRRSLSRQTSNRTISQEVKSTGAATAMPMRENGSPIPFISSMQKAERTNDSGTFNRSSSVSTKRPELRRVISSIPPTMNTTPQPLMFLQREESRSNTANHFPVLDSPGTHTLPSLNLSERRLLPARRSMTSLMTESSLADAIVASSLASSRAPSPYTLSTPPISRLRSRSRHMFQHPHHHHSTQVNSRTPSPPKAMRHTMRQHHDSDEDEDEDMIPSRRRRKPHFLNKHPNKHQEGARKRWRDVVTERERKRYEGVWAANKGIHVSVEEVESSPVKSLQQSQHRLLSVESLVLNIVVRDIWSRSRLGNEVLEEIWDLVDRKGLGLLEREEFVVGMWLIDQRLKGRKLPVKVSVSVWESVRALRGIKIPKRKT
ncbi:MAG: Increased rDNA silencing protein [Peltula sp. TS41687]|nr:MAG: Increased rDNA silencing protein [Peltula sp. TS41687]